MKLAHSLILEYLHQFQTDQIEYSIVGLVYSLLLD